MEEVVSDIYKDVIDDMDVCKCEKCTKDIMAISLNNLPPKYVVSEDGALYSKINYLKNQYEVDVITEITKAAMKVKENPHH